MLAARKFRFFAMPLTCLGKMTENRPLKTPRATPGVGLALCLALATGACVSSTEPILSDARAILGERGQLHIFSAPKDGARTVVSAMTSNGGATAT